MTNDATYRSMLRRAERDGENVIFVLDADPLFKGWCACYKVPVPGELDRAKHHVASFMHLSEFHGYFHGPFELTDQRLYTLYPQVKNETAHSG